MILQEDAIVSEASAVQWSAARKKKQTETEKLGCNSEFGSRSIHRTAPILAASKEVSVGSSGLAAVSSINGEEAPGAVISQTVRFSKPTLPSL